MKSKFPPILLLLLFLCGAPSVRSENPAGQNIGFDLAHKEIFSPFTDRPLDYSFLGRLMTGAGYRISKQEKPISTESLKGMVAYVIAGPTQPFEKTEVEALRQFVTEGGKLVVLLHIAPPVARLTESFGIIVSNFVVSEKEDVIGGQPQDFLVTRFSGHPVTRGLKSVTVHGTWALMADEPASLLAETSPEAWFDMNRNRQWDPDEPRMASGIMAASRLGKGEVLVVADDAPFNNSFLDEADNSRLADNILLWLK